MDESDAMLIAVSQAEAEEDLSEDEENEQALATAAIIGGVEIAQEIWITRWHLPRHLALYHVLWSYCQAESLEVNEMGRNERCDTIEWEP